MEKIKKVKRGLECCIVKDPDDSHKCVDCPYRDPIAYCANRLHHDALDVIQTLTSDKTCGSDSCGF